MNKKAAKRGVRRVTHPRHPGVAATTHRHHFDLLLEQCFWIKTNHTESHQIKVNQTKGVSLHTCRPGEQSAID
jgi:hypothetical protein